MVDMAHMNLYFFEFHEVHICDANTICMLAVRRDARLISNAFFYIPLLALALSAASLRVHKARSEGGTTSSDTSLTSAAAASVAATAASAAHCDGVRLSGGSSLPVIGRGSLPS
jgi:hypothetical protein